MSLAAIKQNCKDEHAHQLIVAFGNILKKNSTDFPLIWHSLTEKCLKSTRDQVDYLHETVNKQGKILEEIKSASQLGANYAERAAEQKLMEEMQEADENALTLPFMVKKFHWFSIEMVFTYCFTDTTTSHHGHERQRAVPRPETLAAEQQEHHQGRVAPDRVQEDVRRPPPGAPVLGVPIRVRRN